MTSALERELNLKETELCLGLPGGSKSSKRGFSETVDLKLNLTHDQDPTAVDLPPPNKDPVAKPPNKSVSLNLPDTKLYIIISFLNYSLLSKMIKSM